MSTTATELKFDPRETKLFLDALRGGDCRKKVFAFQTFRDGKKDRTLAKRGRTPSRERRSPILSGLIRPVRS